MNSYPWFIDNWLGSRTRMTLSPLARCVYRELLDQCWKHGSLPKDHEILAKMALVSSREFRAAWKEISPLFQEKNGEFHHELVDEKRPQLVEYKRNRSESGRKGAQAKLQAEPQAKPPAKGQHSHKLSSSTATGLAQAPIPIPIPTEREAVVDTPKQTRATAAPQQPIDWSGPDPAQEVSALVEELAATWPNPGSVPHAKLDAEREFAKSGTDVLGWVAKVRGSAAVWRDYHLGERAKSDRHFVPHLAKWFREGDFARPAPAAAVAKGAKHPTCPECLNTGWVMLADLPTEAISGLWDSKQLDAWQALNRRRCGCAARAG
jgi:uncharacterized protein YdaU (DUF1376 family)